eukprot:Rhum_TRINITY_DN14851_c19_g1::Rhum_TRINITY_DN14851_c19_g1_i1::g.123084::m.123084
MVERHAPFTVSSCRRRRRPRQRQLLQISQCFGEPVILGQHRPQQRHRVFRVPHAPLALLRRHTRLQRAPRACDVARRAPLPEDVSRQVRLLQRRLRERRRLRRTPARCEGGDGSAHQQRVRERRRARRAPLLLTHLVQELQRELRLVLGAGQRHHLRVVRLRRHGHDLLEHHARLLEVPAHGRHTQQRRVRRVEEVDVRILADLLHREGTGEVLAVRPLKLRRRAAAAAAATRPLSPVHDLVRKPVQQHGNVAVAEDKRLRLVHRCEVEEDGVRVGAPDRLEQPGDVHPALADGGERGAVDGAVLGHVAERPRLLVELLLQRLGVEGRGVSPLVEQVSLDRHVRVVRLLLRQLPEVHVFARVHPLAGHSQVHVADLGGCPADGGREVGFVAVASLLPEPQAAQLRLQRGDLIAVEVVCHGACGGGRDAVCCGALGGVAAGGGGGGGGGG